MIRSSHCGSAVFADSALHRLVEVEEEVAERGEEMPRRVADDKHGVLWSSGPWIRSGSRRCIASRLVSNRVSDLICCTMRTYDVDLVAIAAEKKRAGDNSLAESSNASIERCTRKCHHLNQSSLRPLHLGGEKASKEKTDGSKASWRAKQTTFLTG